MKKDNLVYLDDIKRSLEKIIEYSNNFDSADQVKVDSMVYDALIRRIQIVGEATNRLTDEFKANYPEVDWKNIKGLRNLVVHEYDNILDEQLWLIVKKDVPITLELITDIINREEQQAA